MKNYLLIVFSGNSQMTEIGVKKLARIHSILCDSTGLLAKSFNLQILLLFTIFNLFDLLCFFEVLHNLTKNFEITTEDFILNIFDLVWVVFNVYFIIVLIWIAVLLKNEAQKTSDLLHRLEGKCVALHFATQIEHHHVVISSGMYEYNWTFIYLVSNYLKICYPIYIHVFLQIISWTLTYVIVLIQFDIAPMDV